MAFNKITVEWSENTDGDAQSALFLLMIGWTLSLDGEDVKLVGATELGLDYQAWDEDSADGTGPVLHKDWDDFDTVLVY